MGLRFVIGRAGTGKTHTCLTSIKRSAKDPTPGTDIIFLVPEQSTFQMEWSLVSDPGLPGIIRAQVLSFRRLAWRVFSEAGGGSRTYVGETGKNMILRSLLEDLSGDLTLFRRSTSQVGFVDLLSRTIQEIKACRVSHNDFARWLSRPGNRQKTTLWRKMRDLGLILSSLDRALEGRLLDPDDYLSLLSEKIPYSALVTGSEVWVDGFSGFTPQEYEVLRAVMARASTVNVALCLDPDRLGPHRESDLFYTTWETYQALSQMALDLGVAVDEPLMLREQQRFPQATDLVHLESGFDSVLPDQWTGPLESIRVLSAPARRAEIQWAAREMVRLARDRGFRWRDMSLIVRNLDDYHHLVSTVLSDHGIPFFMDRKRSLSHHPVVELIRSALELVSGWGKDPILRILKTDLLPLDRPNADMLENYIIAHGIRGRRWTDGQRWEYRRRFSLVGDEGPDENGDDFLDQIAAARQVVVDSLDPLTCELNQPGTYRVSFICRQIYDLLERLDVPGTLADWEQEAAGRGDLDLSREQGQVWSLTSDLIDQAVAALGDREMTVSEFARVMESGMESMQVGLIPPSLDQVLVGAIDRSRQPDVKAVFLLGVTDGVFPDPCPEDVVFTDSEREELANGGITLSPGGSGLLWREQYLAYVAMTRPSQSLYVTYPQADDSGRVLLPSALIAKLHGMFPDLVEMSIPALPAGDEGDIHFLTTASRASGELLAHARIMREQAEDVSPLWMEVYRWLLESPAWHSTARRILAALCHKNLAGPLPQRMIQKLLPSPLPTSVSRLERFNRCPFSHFLAHTLGLIERPVHRLTPPDLGTFFHAALDQYIQVLMKDGRNPGDPDSGERDHILSGVVERLAPRFQSEILMSSLRHDYQKMILIRRLRRAVSALAEHCRGGQFRPATTELGFGTGGPVPPLRIALSDGRVMLVRGRVDLVETARYQQVDYVRVIDFKSGDSRLDLAGVFHGIDLQLLTYLQVVIEHAHSILGRPVRPAGMFYFPVRDPLLVLEPGTVAEEVQARLQRAVSMRGLVLSDPGIVRLMADEPQNLIGITLNRDGTPRKGSPTASAEGIQNLLTLVQKRLSEAGSRLLSGEISISPYRRGSALACTHCPYRAPCGFDALVNQDGYRTPPDLSNEEIWEKIGEVIP